MIPRLDALFTTLGALIRATFNVAPCTDCAHSGRFCREHRSHLGVSQ
jgi:hypothetical protein